MAVGTGAVSGVLIGTGIGVAGMGALTVGALVTTASATLISAGTGTFIASESYMFVNHSTGNSFDSTDFAVSAIGGAIEGAVAPGLGTFGSILASGAISGLGSITSDTLNNQPVNPQKALANSAWGLASGGIGQVASNWLSPIPATGGVIKPGAQFIDMTWQNVKDPILQQWIAGPVARSSARATFRTILRNLPYDFVSDTLQEQTQ